MAFRQQLSDLDVQSLPLMIKHDLAVVAAIGEVVLEDVLGPQRNVATELVPLREAGVEGGPQRLSIHKVSFAWRTHALDFGLYRAQPSA
jgi:hypothetical protein